MVGAVVAVLLLIGASPLPRPPSAVELDEARLALAESYVEVVEAAAAPARPGTDALDEAVERHREALARVDRLVEHVENSHPLARFAEQLRVVMRGPADRGTAGLLSRPVRGMVTSGFGPRALPAFGGGHVHEGIDIATLPGTPVRAAASGTVVVADDLDEAGNTVVLDHGVRAGLTVQTVYSHLDDIAVAVDEKITVGAEIGGVGSTGALSTGPHLHFEVLVEGVPVDPRTWF